MLPALSQSRPLRYAVFAAAYVTQGVQVGLVTVALPVVLARSGVGPGGVGAFVGAVTLPWALKPLAAPLLERYGFLAMGRRRPWALAGALGGAAGYVAMSLVPDPVAGLALLTAAAASGNAALGLQDVAVDGLAVDVVPEPEQPQANALMWGGKVAGIAGASAGGAALVAAVGLSGALLAAAALTAAVGLLLVAVRERPGERLLPWTAGEASRAAGALHLGAWGPIARGLRRVLVLPASARLVAAGACAGAAYGLFDALLPALTAQELGWAGGRYGAVVAVGAVAGGAVGVALGAAVVRRAGRGRAVAGVLLALAVAAAATGAARGAWAGGALEAFVVVALVLRSLSLITLSAAGMAAAWRPVGAAQFAVYAGAWPLGAAGGAALLGPAVAAVGYPAAFGVLAAFALAGAVAVAGLRLDAHAARLDALDAAPPRPPLRESVGA